MLSRVSEASLSSAWCAVPGVRSPMMVESRWTLPVRPEEAGSGPFVHRRQVPSNLCTLSRGYRSVWNSASGAFKPVVPRIPFRVELGVRCLQTCACPDTRQVRLYDRRDRLSAVYETALVYEDLPY